MYEHHELKKMSIEALQRRLEVLKSNSEKLDDLIDPYLDKHLQDQQINILNIPKLYNEARTLVLQGVDANEAARVAVDKYKEV